MLQKIGLFGLLCLLSVGLLFPASALAHKVNVFAYVEDGIVYAESYFPDGRPVAKGKIQVFDDQQQLLLEGVTDAVGLFQFKVPKVTDLTLVITASMGHKNHFLLKKSAFNEE
jgi:nickel transport protein